LLKIENITMSDTIILFLFFVCCPKTKDSATTLNRFFHIVSYRAVEDVSYNTLPTDPSAKPLKALINSPFPKTSNGSKNILSEMTLA
jgi:hypothetical protein